MVLSMPQHEEDALILGKEKISKLLFKFALPAIAAMVASSLYNVIAGIFIASLGAFVIAGVGITMPFMNMAAAFGALVGVGASVVCSIYLGEKKYERARQVLCNLIILNLVLGILFSVVGLVYLDPILVLLGASENTLQPAHEYMEIILAGNVFAHMYLGLNSVMRVSGYPTTAMNLTFLSVAINLALAPLLIFVCDMGVRGAAFATVIAQIICCIIQFYLFLKGDKVVYIERDKFKPDWEIIKRSFFIGSPNFCTNAAACFVVILINNALLNYGGDLHVGAYTIVNRIAAMFFMIVLGFSQGMQPIVAYNFGAKQYDRMWQAFKLTLKCAFAVTMTGTLVCEFFPALLTRMFVAPETPLDLELTGITITGFRLMMAAFWIICIQVIGSNFLSSMNQPMKSLALSLTRQLIILIPLIILLPKVWGIHGVWLSMPLSDVLSAICAALVIVHEWRKQKNQRETLAGHVFPDDRKSMPMIEGTETN